VLRLRGVEDSLRQANYNQDMQAKVLQKTLEANNIPIPEGFHCIPSSSRNARRPSSPSMRGSSTSPAVQIDLTSLGQVQAHSVVPVEAAELRPHSFSPSLTAVDSDAMSTNAFSDPLSIGPGSTNGVMVDLTTLASIEPIKWCGETAAESPLPLFKSPEYFDQWQSNQASGQETNMRILTLNSQEAINFVLE
jgi:hypothetical protein